MGDIKIAYIVQAHKNANQINELVKRLDGKGRYFFVHIDKKSDIVEDIIRRENIVLLEDRINVKWGDISMVKAMLKLMQAVRDSKIDVDYVWLISGQDFPIKNYKEINNFLEQNKGSNFIDVMDENDPLHPTFLKRCTTYWPAWMRNETFIIKLIRRIYTICTGGNQKSFFQRKNTLGVKFKFGSNWFTITKDAMEYILDECQRKEYLAYYKNCYFPDESFIQTILCNSYFEKSIKPNLLYVDWSAGKANPKILGVNDFQMLCQSDKLIARKFDGEIDEKIKSLSKNEK